MIMELIHTSVPRGLNPGTRGFTTVAHTKGMPAWLVESLERLSGYSQSSQSKGTGGESPRIVYRFAILQRGNSAVRVLSRIAPCSPDYSGRSNRIAHHIMLPGQSLSPAGPVSLLGQSSLFRQEWTEAPKLLEAVEGLPNQEVVARPCNTWQNLTGDAGWAGWLLHSWIKRPSGPLYLRHPENWPILDLLNEVTALVPPPARWKLTFSTAVSGEVDPGITCALRCVPSSTASPVAIPGMMDANTIDLVARASLPECEYANNARAGRVITLKKGTQAASKKLVAPRPQAVQGDVDSMDQVALSEELLSKERAASAPSSVILVKNDKRVIAACSVGAFLLGLIIGAIAFRSSAPDSEPELGIAEVREDDGEVGDDAQESASGSSIYVENASTDGLSVATLPTRIHTEENEGEIPLADDRATQSIAKDDQPDVQSIEKAELEERLEDAQSPTASKDVNAPITFAIAKQNEIEPEQFSFAPALFSSDGIADIPVEWMSADRKLEIMWLAQANGSLVTDRELRFDGAELYADKTTPMSNLGPPKPLLTIKAAEAGTIKLKLSKLSPSLTPKPLSGFYLKHPTRHKYALAIMWPNPTVNSFPCELIFEEPARKNSSIPSDWSANECEFENWSIGIPHIETEWSWEFSEEKRKEESEKIIRFGRSSDESVLVITESTFTNGKPNQIDVEISRDLPGKEARELPILEILRRINTHIRSGEELSELLVIRNAYGLPIIELVFEIPASPEQAATNNSETDDGNSDDDKGNAE
ncbi:MAG TPA: hypothetical protein PKN33_08605 [Phycisphaerae bacterium]|nr:hypothetical protein [Phycisphaerae bacterium]